MLYTFHIRSFHVIFKDTFLHNLFILASVFAEGVFFVFNFNIQSYMHRYSISLLF